VVEQGEERDDAGPGPIAASREFIMHDDDIPSHELLASLNTRRHYFCLVIAHHPSSKEEEEKQKD
jgi:hypothetical protein